MIRAIADVIRGEGAASAIRRAKERFAESVQDAALRTRGWFARASNAAIVNVSASSVSPRMGGVAIQLLTRLRDERGSRNVALLHPGGLQLSAPFAHARRIVARDFENAVREALSITGAHAVQIEGISGVPLDGILRLLASGVAVVVSVHDFSLFCARPHLIEQPMDRFCFYSHDLDRCHRCLLQTWDVPRIAQAERRAQAREILTAATGVIFPSRFLFDKHRELFSLPDLKGEVIEPAVPRANRIAHVDGVRRAVAYAGAVKRHKGGHLLPDVARMLAARGLDLHVLGGGDLDLLRALRQLPNVVIHGYYRSRTLPPLLARHRIGLVVLPSIWPETFCMTLSEAWLAGASVGAFDLGAPAERIRREGGGWLAPLESGASGLVEIIDRWLALEPDVPRVATSPGDAARAHLDLYRRSGLLP